MAFPFGAKTENPLLMYLSDVCTIPSNLAGHPAMSVPFGTGAHGLPVGVQLLAPTLEEATMFRAAAVLEAAAPDESTWEMVIGLEVHAELHTRTKIFCACPNRFGDEPNTNICPVCLGLPGSLPVLNEQVVELAIRLGEALQCEVQSSIFHRKNYFYPDMPKDYQVSQYDRPINAQGWLELPSGTRVGITRAHLEEDTGKSSHMGDSGGRIHGSDFTLVDYNRAGVPLLEIVSEPDLRSSDDARAYVNELRAILVATGVSDAKMEEGSMRVDANVSMRPAGSDALGTRCEIKNLNSVRSLGRAIEYEAARQIEAAGGRARPSARRRATGPRTTGAPTRCGPRKRPTTTATSPSPTSCRSRPTPSGSGRVRSSMPMLPAERRRRVWPPPPARGADASGVVVAVERGLDELAVAAIEAGGDPARVLVHVEHNLSGDGADRLQPARLAALTQLEVERQAHGDPGQGGAGRARRRRRRRRPGGHRRGQGLRGHGHLGPRRRHRRGHRRQPAGVGALPRAARTRWSARWSAR